MFVELVTRMTHLKSISWREFCSFRDKRIEQYVERSMVFIKNKPPLVTHTYFNLIYFYRWKISFRVLNWKEAVKMNLDQHESGAMIIVL